MAFTGHHKQNIDNGKREAKQIEYSELSEADAID
jgi:hypothetical protein